MNIIKKYTNESKWVKLVALLFIIGFFFGALMAVLLKDSYSNQLSDLNSTFFINLNSTTVDHNRLFQLIIIKKYKSILLLFSLCTTVLGVPYLAFYLVLKGFNIGFIFAASITQYKIKGFFLFLLYLFPQYFIYVPVMALTVLRGYYLNKQLHYNLQNRKTTKKIIIEQIPFLLIVAVLLLLGSALEAYVNAPILEKIIPALF